MDRCGIHVIFDDGSTDATVADIRRVMASTDIPTMRLHRNPEQVGYR